jgi:4-amino-4-deoxy-L-arabinose transferase-like glycosyltransferase
MTGPTSVSRLSASGYTLYWAGLWLVLMAVALKFRPFLPVDETRYLAVAWEMWRDKNFVVPHLNGEPYSHKPPLLFWLMQAGWAVFGVNDWWPRLVAPLFGLGSLFLTALLARRLWPGRTMVAVAAPLILLACLFWTLFTTLTMFDMLLAFCALLGMWGILIAWQDNNTGGFFWLAFAIGLGALAKGPAILLSTLPVAILAPLWTSSLGLRESEVEIEGVEMQPSVGTGMWIRGWKKWYIGIGFALLGGVAIGLIWAIPAAIKGGEEYRNAIFWGQSAGRMVDSFAHGRPWWWFLAVLPGLVLPWTVWPASWRSLRGLLDIREDNGLRFCLVWFLPALITFSAISGKQLHYLLPVFPALALAMGRLLVDHHDVDQDETSWTRSGLQVPGALFVLFGLIIGIAPLATRFIDLPATIAEVDFIWGLGLAVFAFAIIVLTRNLQGLMPRLACVVLLSTAVVATIHLSLRPVLAERFDLIPISQKLGEWQRSGFNLAFSGKYHGQFNFMGRLQKTITTIGLVDRDIKKWLAENPQGRIVTVTDDVPEMTTPVYSQPYRGRTLIVIDASQAIAFPIILEQP